MLNWFAHFRDRDTRHQVLTSSTQLQNTRGKRVFAVFCRQICKLTTFLSRLYKLPNIRKMSWLLSLTPIRRIVIFLVNLAVQLQMPEQEEAQDVILKNQRLLIYEVQKNARFVAPGLMGKLYEELHVTPLFANSYKMMRSVGEKVMRNFGDRHRLENCLFGGGWPYIKMSIFAHWTGDSKLWYYYCQYCH